MSAIVAAYGPFEESAVSRMLARIAHRGPDGMGIQQTGEDTPAWLGSRYLSITDPENGTQPVAGSTPGTWMVGDGKIYNYRRIREQLGTDRFRTEADLEAALALFEDQGIGAFAQLWGTFALVIATDDGQFVAARDALGVAPLYWARKGDTVLFASELKAFDEDWRADVQPFPPGHIWTPTDGLSAGPRFPASTQVILTSRALNEEPPPWVFDAIRDTIIRSVQRSMDAVVPIGVLLSGGVDSSIVTAIAAQYAAERGWKLPTFSVGMTDSGDLMAARAVAEHTGTDHHELTYTAEEAIELVPKVIAQLESFESSLVHSAVPHNFVNELASQEVKVVLAGEGADELFAGYEYFGDYETGERLHDELVTSVEGMHGSGLQRVDRIAGAHGIEARLPFLDLDVVELALALPAEWKLLSEGRPAKWMLRRAFDGWLPDDILWRRKEKFGEGTGMNDVLNTHFAATVTEAELREEGAALDPPLETREELAYYRILNEALPGLNLGQMVGRFPEEI